MVPCRVKFRGMASTQTKFLTTNQAADEFGVHVETIRRWIANGTLKAVKVRGGQYRIARTDWNALVRTGGTYRESAPLTAPPKLAVGKPDVVDAHADDPDAYPTLIGDEK